MEELIYNLENFTTTLFLDSINLITAIAIWDLKMIVVFTKHGQVLVLIPMEATFNFFDDAPMT